jgi:protein O-mannosyl-transferase
MKLTKKYWLISLIAPVLAVLLYSNTFNHGYVLDDFDAIVDNRIVKQGLDGISEIWATEYRQGYSSDRGSLYRPLTLSLFAIEWEIWPYQPQAAHIIQVLLFGICCWILFLWLTQLFGDRDPWLSVFIALLFAAHPIHTEVAANIKSGDEILAMLFGLLSMWLFLKSEMKIKSGFFLLSVTCFFLALTSKESAVTLLPIFPLSMWFFKRNEWKKSLVPLAFFAIPLAGFFMLRNQAIGGFSGREEIPALDNMLVAASGVEWFTSVVSICGLYLWKLVFPLSLSHDYSLNEIPLSGLSHWRFWLSILAAGLLIYTFIKTWKSQPIVAFAIAFFAITFSLYSNLVFTIGTHFGERLLFLPSLGFCMVVGWYLWSTATKKTGQFELKKAGLPAGFLAILCLGYASKTMSRSAEWRDEMTLYSADVINAPNSTRTHFRLGRTYNKRGLMETTQATKNSLFEKAIPELEKSIEIYPEYSDAIGELGLAYQSLGDFKQAMKLNNRALEINPNQHSVINNVGAILFLQNKTSEAIPYFKKTLELNPNHRDAAGNLGSCYGTLGQYEEAIYWFKKAIEIDPTYASNYFFVALSYQNLSDDESSKVWLAKARELDPNIGK